MYAVGSRVHLSAVFTASNGARVDPTSVALVVKEPSGFIASKTPVRESIGKYGFDLDVDDAGQWAFRFSSEGIGKAAAEGEFFVKETELA